MENYKCVDYEKEIQKLKFVFLNFGKDEKSKNDYR
jgi:hypothetical protein